MKIIWEGPNTWVEAHVRADHVLFNVEFSEIRIEIPRREHSPRLIAHQNLVREEMLIRLEEMEADRERYRFEQAVTKKQVIGDREVPWFGRFFGMKTIDQAAMKAINIAKEIQTKHDTDQRKKEENRATLEGFTEVQQIVAEL